MNKSIAPYFQVPKEAPLSPRQPVHIYLIGFSGSGKSTVGPLLARRLNRRYVDTDMEIEKRENLTIAQVFAVRGEAHFRDIERTIIQEIAECDQPTVVALGGGAFQSQVNREITHQSGLVIYLRTSLQILYRRLQSQTDRPLLQVRPQPGESLRQARLRRIRELLQARETNYRAADIIIPTSAKSPEEVADTITTYVRQHYAND